MTLTMLLLGIFWGTGGAILSYEMGESFGMIGYIVGYIGGAAASYLFTWIFTVGRLRLFFPLPVCRRGRCRGYDDYHWPTSTIYGWEIWRTYRYRCRCDDEYLRIGKKFLEVLPNDEMRSYKTRPYQRMTSFRCWVDDRRNSAP